MSKLTIDNKTYEVKEGNNLLETCLTLGMNLPYFCWHPALGSVGACRQCAVKMFKDENDKTGRLVMSCMETVRNDLRISINDGKAFREQVVEWLMTNHPHDCPVCDEGGSCHLQDMTVMTGHDYRRFDFKKRTYRNQYLGPFIHHEMNRCIQCYRCVRFYHDYAGGEDLNVFAAHNHVYFGREEDGMLQSPFSGNLAEVCPTGVFTDKTLKEHYTRKWDLTSAPSVCMNCSLGCNILAGERYGELRLITNRYHPEINGYFICDRGRFGYEYVNNENRVYKPVIRDRVPEVADINEIIERVKKLAATSVSIVGIGSSRASLETNYVLRKLVGEKNFYGSFNNTEAKLHDVILHFMQSSGVSIPSLKQVEQADAILIVGEDITNTAPMLALALRQAIYKTAVQEHLSGHNIPEWHDSAVRNMVQEDKGWLGILNTYKESLSPSANEMYVAKPVAITELLMNVIALIKGETSSDKNTLANTIAGQLKKAKHPLIITGTGCFSIDVLHAAMELAKLLKKQNENASISFVVPDCNSIGLAMMNAPSAEQLMSVSTQIESNATLILTENDLYRRFPQQQLEAFFKRFTNIIVLDSLHNQTTEKATVLVPAATFAEGNGTVVNNEARAQAFYKVLVNRPAAIRASWQWLNDFLPQEKRVQHHVALLQQLVNDMPQFAGIENQVARPGSVNGHEEKIPMAPHRYSGRTAMLANIAVSEPKPVTDDESIFSTTMEGERQLPPSPLTPFYWWPGWNSVQALNHYQRETGGLLKGEAGGIKLLAIRKEEISKEQTTTNETRQDDKEELWIYPRYHLYGSEELSVYTKGIEEQSPRPYIAVNNNEAANRNWKNGTTIEIEIEETNIAFEVKCEDNIPEGIALIPYGIKETYGIAYPYKTKLKNNV